MKILILSSLFGYLCDNNAVTYNPVKGAERPTVESYERKTSALGYHEARNSLPIISMSTDLVYKVVRLDAEKVWVDNANGFGVHSLRPTTATNAFDREVDIAKGHEELGHANIATTRLYDSRNSRPEDSPTLVNYF